MSWLRASLGWSLVVWRLVMLWTVVLVVAWLAQLLCSLLLLSWAEVSIEFPSANAETDEFVNGPRPVGFEDEPTTPRGPREG